ncbi:MAG: hypothetical protein OEZ58_01065 [Gammaproteobacteria bacterium]|nr:hypothetical protein [Gammaproteobacteria bacterium]MDH5727566.1 hypothetical protein [Gammaproteobacteria bacterium]
MLNKYTTTFLLCMTSPSLFADALGLWNSYTDPFDNQYRYFNRLDPTYSLGLTYEIGGNDRFALLISGSYGRIPIGWDTGVSVDASSQALNNANHVLNIGEIDTSMVGALFKIDVSGKPDRGIWLGMGVDRYYFEVYELPDWDNLLLAIDGIHTTTYIYHPNIQHALGLRLAFGVNLMLTKHLGISTSAQYRFLRTHMHHEFSCVVAVDCKDDQVDEISENLDLDSYELSMGFMWRF